MSAELTKLLMTALHESNVVEPAAWAALTKFVEENRPEPPALVREIRRRGVLTDFQIKEVSRGRGKDLTLGPYTLLDLLGEGGMGRVFKAHHNRLGRDVALKVIRKEKLTKPTVVQRFHQEIRAAAQLSHPNVILAFDADEADGIHYYAMEYAEGLDLTKVVAGSGPIAIPLACDYVRQAAVGLQHAYERGLVHRDVKPSNLLLTPKGQIKVLDLGLAMLNENLGGGDAKRVTQEGLVLGTPDFLAPEQAQNPLGVDIRADVYALGATLYYLITGRVPYDGATPADKLMQHVLAPPPRLLAVKPDAPPALDAVIQWLMAKKPADRPQTPAQAAMALLPFCPAGGGGGPAAAVSGFAPVAYAPAPTPVGPQTTPPPWTAPETAVEVAPVPAEAPRQAYKPRKQSSGVGKVLIFAALGLGGLGAAAGLAYVLYRAAAATAGPSGPLAKDFTSVQGLKLVRLEGGRVELGSGADSPGHDANESPTATAEVPGPFYLATTETTHGQYQLVMGNSPAKWATRMRNPKAMPVDSVTFDEAVEFCKKLNALDKANVRAGWAYRLPTEAEWEYAARAGTSGPFSVGEKLVYGRGGIFSLDKELDAKNTLGEPDLSKTLMEKDLPYPVRSTDANAFGLYDLYGNVWEWVGDAYEPGHAATPRVGAAGDWRVQKGGSWQEPAARCRSAARRGMSPGTRHDDAGFRVAYAPAAKP